MTGTSTPSSRADSRPRSTSRSTTSGPRSLASCASSTSRSSRRPPAATPPTATRDGASSTATAWTEELIEASQEVGLLMQQEFNILVREAIRDFKTNNVDEVRETLREELRIEDAETRKLLASTVTATTRHPRPETK